MEIACSGIAVIKCYDIDDVWLSHPHRGDLLLYCKVF